MAAKEVKKTKAKPVRRSREELIEDARARLAKLENADREKDKRRHSVLTEQQSKLDARIADLNAKRDVVHVELVKLDTQLEGYVTSDGVGEA